MWGKSTGQDQSVSGSQKVQWEDSGGQLWTERKKMQNSRTQYLIFHKTQTHCLLLITQQGLRDPQAHVCACNLEVSLLGLLSCL